jgi:hypothetical protein
VDIDYYPLSWILLHEEESRRLSLTTQKKMAEAESSGWQSWMTIAEAIQIQICVDYKIDIQLGLKLIRQPIHSSLHSISFYRRHNRVARCTLKIGDPFPSSSITLVNAETRQPTGLGSDHKSDYELVVTGSFT